MKSPGRRQLTLVASALLALAGCASPPPPPPPEPPPEDAGLRVQREQEARRRAREEQQAQGKTTQAPLEPRPAPEGSADTDVAELAAQQASGQEFKPAGRYRGIWGSMEDGQVRVGGEHGWLVAIRSAVHPNDQEKELIAFLPESRVTRLESEGAMARLLSAPPPTVRVLLGPPTGPLPVPPILALDLE